MHDCFGNPVEVGSKVTIDFEVISVVPAAKICNITLEGVIPEGVDGLESARPFIDTNAKMCRLTSLPDGIPAGDPVALTFGQAIEAMRHGKKVRLPKWSPDVFISIQMPDENSKMTAPYFYVTSRFGLVPWIPTMIEMFSVEWAIAE